MREFNNPDVVICSDVIEHIVNPNKLIDYLLELKSNTISTFKKSILSKTGVSNNIELFKLAQEHKIV